MYFHLQVMTGAIIRKIVLLLFAISNWPVHANSATCELDKRFGLIAAFDQLASQLNLSSKADQLAFELAEVEYAASQRAISEYPLDLRYQSTAGRSRAGSEFDTPSFASSGNTLSGSVDLTPGQHGLSTEISRAQTEISRIKVSQQKIMSRVNVLKTLTQIAEAGEILAIYGLEQQVASDRLAFYEKRLELGDSVQSQMADFVTRVREIGDRQRSAEVRRVTLATSIDLMPDAFQTLPEWSTELDAFKPTYCESKSFQSVLAQEQTELSSMLRSRAFRNRLPSFEGGISISQERARQRETWDSQVSITLEVPLYSGNSLSNAERDAEDQLALSRVRADLLARLDRESSVRQYSIEEIYHQSLMAQLERLSGVRKKIAELLKRQQMGQSVYEELTDNMLEELKVRESIVRLQSEAILSWLDFMADQYE